MKNIKVLGLPIMIAMVIVAGLNAQTNPQSTDAARLVARSGMVDIQRGNDWVPLNPGAAINTGDRVRTGSRSSAAIELGPGKIVTLSERTEVQVRQSNGTPIVQLEAGNMKVVAAEDIQVAAKETVLQTTEKPVDIEVGFEADKINLTVITGAVRNGPITIRAVQQDSSKRTITAGGRSAAKDNAVPYPAPYPAQYPASYPAPYFYPYPVYGYSYGGLFAQPGFIQPGFTQPGLPPQGTVPPVVYNPTHPAYRPDQIVPPMTDPLRPPNLPFRR
jgi:hypothetical protein